MPARRHYVEKRDELRDERARVRQIIDESRARRDDHSRPQTIGTLVRLDDVRPPKATV